MNALCSCHPIVCKVYLLRTLPQLVLFCMVIPVPVYFSSCFSREAYEQAGYSSHRRDASRVAVNSLPSWCCACPTTSQPGGVCLARCCSQRLLLVSCQELTYGGIGPVSFARLNKKYHLEDPKSVPSNFVVLACVVFDKFTFFHRSDLYLVPQWHRCRPQPHERALHNDMESLYMMLIGSR